MELLIGILLLGLFVVCLWVPAWWLTSRLDDRIQQLMVRVPVSIGIALVAYLTVINLLGKLLENSLQAVFVYLMFNTVAYAILLWKHRPELDMTQLWYKKRSWIGIVLIAVLLATPQWFQAVSGNRWDEMASSSIHITAPNQFAEGVFPPRHNAFPDIIIKYHYGFTLLSGTVRWITQLSSNVSIDIVSTGLWLFIFLFTYAWMRQLGMTKIASGWGGFSVLLGGGLSWLYLPWIQAYKGFQKLPTENALIHSYDSDVSWWGNLLSVMTNQSIHLKNAGGDIFPLPFDIAVHYQQHAVALGIALTLVAAHVFWLWQTRRDFAPVLGLISIFCFSLVFLGHAVFGSVSSLSAGLVLLVLWLRKPSKIRFFQGILFTIGVTILAFLHGGMLATGDEYGPPGAPVAIRDSIGYISGSLFDHINWILAGFGLPFIFAILTLWIWLFKRNISSQRAVFLTFFGLFALVSFTIPQLMYFSHGGGIEEQTEISKFFFCTHLAIAILSVIGIDYLSRRLNWLVILPLFLMTAITPVAVSISDALNIQAGWNGFYRSPYDWEGGRNYKATGEALRSLKKSNLDQYYDFSTAEVSSAYLNELLVYGGSVFTLSPTRYEITGFGFLIAEDRVADRVLLEGRMARLLPGAAEASGTNWLNMVAEVDLARRPTIVRSRFAKMVSEGMLIKRNAAGPRELFEIEGDTQDLDQGIEKYWAPKVISQTHSDWDGDGKIDLLFFDYKDNVIRLDEEIINLADQSKPPSGFPLIFLARFPGDKRADLLVGYMSDAVYSRGETISSMVRKYPFQWQRRDSLVNHWEQAGQYWSWLIPIDIPLVADHDNDGFDSQIVYQLRSGRWSLFPNHTLDGPSLPASVSPLPVVGRFLPGSTRDLALWSPVNGQFEVKSLSNGETVSTPLGGLEGDILLPGDYDGDGYDEISIWQPHSNIWWVRKMPAGPDTPYTFGTSSSIPLPADYDNDGRIDLAYWEPEEHKIYVSFDFGETQGMTIMVPAHSIPIFVHMY